MTTPKYFDQIWANSGIVTAISDTVTGDGTVNYPQGWTSLYQTNIGSGGKKMDLGAWNQFCYDVTSNLQQWQIYSVPSWYSTAAYSLYSKVLYTDGNVYRSLQNGNVGNTPSASSLYWQIVNQNERIRLTGNTYYYVNASTGNDSNPGSSGAPWATIQNAVVYIQQNIDLSVYTATIKVADGDYDPFYVGGTFVGAPAGGVTVQGNVTTPQNCRITTNSTSCVFCMQGGIFSIGGFQLSSTSGGANAIGCIQGGKVIVNGNMVFGSVATGAFHLYCADTGSYIELASNYSITGGATTHFYASSGGQIIVGNTAAIAISNTPAFTNFAAGTLNGMLILNNITFTGTGATGSRYIAADGGLVYTAGAGVNYFPGNAAGTGTNTSVAPYGLYV